MYLLPLWTFLAGLFAYAWASSDMPRVDLGYQIHEAISFNETGRYYNFSNIRFGQAPDGKSRFNVPLKPVINRSTVERGDIGRICSQAFPLWYLRMLAELKGDEYAIKKAQSDPTSLIPPPDPREREDCLFLDVLVPENILGNKSNESYSGAPVMVWFYGGGFTFTDDSGNPAGLIAESRRSSAGSDGIIYVRINYRGGAFGFLSGPELQKVGVANAGLLDQRMALEWVQEHIHKFGGDPGRVTLFGQSAGAGSIMHQITAYGGSQGPVPFSQAILASPGFQPFPSNFQQNTVLHQFLTELNVSTVQEARNLPYKDLAAANTRLVAGSRYGQFTFAPAVDDFFVPALPGQLLLHGQFDKRLRIMTGHNAHEAMFFIDPNSTTDADFRMNLKSSLPAIQDSLIDYVSETLYPPPSSNTSAVGYTTASGRNELSSSEVSFTCNTNFLARAFSTIHPQTFAYQFSIHPAYHGEDVPYIYYNGPSPMVVNETIAHVMQSYYTQFAITGQPNKPGIPEFQAYGTGRQILDLNVTGVRMIHDPTDNLRCHWWQLALYF